MCSTGVSSCRAGKRRAGSGNYKGVTLRQIGYLTRMSALVTTNLSVVWSSVRLVRHASLTCSDIEHMSDIVSNTRARLGLNLVLTGGTQMTITHTLSPRAGSVRRPGTCPSGPVRGRRYARDGLSGSRRPGPSRPAVAPPRYHGTGVAMSVTPHRRRPVTLATTVGLALLAGLITLWLGLVANLGQALNGESDGATARVPDRLAVVRVQGGESLEDVAHRVAPDAPAPQVAQRIRDLNDLGSPTLVAGQTLIAPVG